GWIDSEVKRLSPKAGQGVLSLPHMGWNDVNPVVADPLFDGLESAARFYFLHSYYFAPNKEENVLAVTEYGSRYASSVRAGNVHGVQFHPEKSHAWGIRLLKNFAEMRTC